MKWSIHIDENILSKPQQKNYHNLVGPERDVHDIHTILILTAAADGDVFIYKSP